MSRPNHPFSTSGVPATSPYYQLREPSWLLLFDLDSGAVLEARSATHSGRRVTTYWLYPLTTADGPLRFARVVNYQPVHSLIRRGLLDPLTLHPTPLY